MSSDAVKPKPDQRLNIEERLTILLRHLNLERVHIAAMMPSDWTGFISTAPETVASLTLIAPSAVSADSVKQVSNRTLIFTGDEASDVKRVQQVMEQISDVEHVCLNDYDPALWSDIIADKTEAIKKAMISVVDRSSVSEGVETVALPEGQGTVAGINYTIQGSGVPLLLFPLGLAPTQWDTLLPTLGARFCTIVLTGAELGIIPALEARGKSRGYQEMIASVLADIKVEPGETILDVGCGTGIVNRWLAQRTNLANPITGVDINAYLLSEAAALARQEGLDQILTLQEGNAEALPFPDNHFDIVISSTVMEEVNADKMLAEMIRVTKPDGRVGVIVRATDRPFLVNLPLSFDLKNKVETQSVNRDEGVGCSTDSLYLRFQGSLLINIKMKPYLAVFDQPGGMVEQFISMGMKSQLTPEALREWQSAEDEAVGNGTYFLTWPHHCAVGTKPL